MGDHPHRIGFSARSAFRFAPLAAVVVLAGLGGGLVAYATPWGPWAGSDSVSYVDVARNLAAGRGLVEIQASGNAVAFTKQPPLYPLLLALAGLGGIEAVDAARWFDIALFAALTLSIGFASLRYARRPWAAVGLCLVIVTSPTLLRDFTGVMSEPLFLTFGTLGLILLVAHLGHPNALSFAVSAGLLGLAAVERYAGLVLLMSGALVLLLFDPAPRARRILMAARYLGIAAAPILVWIGIWFLRIGFPRVSQPPGAALWPSLTQFRLALVNTLWNWLPFAAGLPATPYRARLVILLIAGAGFLLLLGIAYSRGRAARPVSSSGGMEWRLAVAFALAGVIFIGFMALVALIGPWYVRIDERQLSPVLLWMSAGTFLTIDFLGDGRRSRYLGPIVQVLFVVGMVTSGFPAARSFLQDMHQNGGGYTSRAWHFSALIKAVRGIPPDVAIISNDPEAILLYARRPAYNLPDLQTGVASPILEQFGSQRSDPLQAMFSRNEAALVMFKEANNRLEPLYGNQTAVRLQSMVRGLDVSSDVWDGTLYYFSPDHP